jgi:hypothetical protein
MTNNTWYQCVATYDGSTRRVYLNTTEIGSRSSNSLNISGNTNLTIARTYANDSEYLNGSLSMVKVYNRALSQAEINSDFAAFRNRFPS